MHPNSNAAKPYAGETNPLTMQGGDYHSIFHKARTVCWTTPGLKVTRFRIISDPGFPAWDVSYCHGYIGDEPVLVDLPFSQVPKRCTWTDKDGNKKPGGWKAYVIAKAKKAGINAYTLNIINAGSTLQ